MKSTLSRVSITAIISTLLIILVSITTLTLTSSAATTRSPQFDIAYASSMHLPGTLTPRVWLPIVMNNFPPAPTISRYVGSSSMMSTTFFYNLGYSRGQTISTGQQVVIIIDFGYPDYDSTSGQYGTCLLVDNTFHSISEITSLSESFLDGFYLSSPSGISLTLAIGVNNSDYCRAGGTSSAHGAAWGQMINNINSWIIGPPYPSWRDKLVAWGAIDAEPSYNTATATRAWVDGYASVYNAQLKSNYLDFGSCGGCAYSDCPACVPTPWSVDDVWYISWGAVPAYPLPEIYRTDGANADQWYRMSVYAYTNHGQLMKFEGSLTQWNACQEQPDPNGCHNIGTDNTEGDGYLQLYYAINADSRTAWAMPWSSDMSWEK
jgi:hypothetical protein